MKTEKEIKKKLERLEKELLHNANCLAIDSSSIGTNTPILIIMDAYQHDQLLVEICELRWVLNIEKAK